MKNFHCYITNPFDNLCEFVLGWIHTLLFEERNSQVLLTYYPLPTKDYHSFDELGRFIKGRYVEYRVEYVPCIWITKLLKSMNCGGSSKDSFQGFKIPSVLIRVSPSRDQELQLFSCINDKYCRRIHPPGFEQVEILRQIYQVSEVYARRLTTLSPEVTNWTAWIGRLTVLKDFPFI